MMSMLFLWLGSTVTSFGVVGPPTEATVVWSLFRSHKPEFHRVLIIDMKAGSLLAVGRNSRRGGGGVCGGRWFSGSNFAATRCTFRCAVRAVQVCSEGLLAEPVTGSGDMIELINYLMMVFMNQVTIFC